MTTNIIINDTDLLEGETDELKQGNDSTENGEDSGNGEGENPEPPEEPEEPKPARPVEELLKLDTFQGMTDEEITLIIQYCCVVAVEDAIFNYENDKQQVLLQAQIDSYAEESRHSMAILETLISEPLQLQHIELKEFDNESEEEAQELQRPVRIS